MNPQARTLKPLLTLSLMHSLIPSACASEKWARVALSLVPVFFPKSAVAWEKHQSLAPWIVKELRLQSIWNRDVLIPCDKTELQNRSIEEALKTGLGLNSKAQLLPLFPNRPCGARIRIRDILLAGILDEPDQGMDDNLPDSADPEGERRWMGGNQGPTSRGFRHMYFGGWQLRHPLSTFQIPLRALGASTKRIEFLTQYATQAIRKNELYWGVRVLGWALHYIQDLAQPFHSAQIPQLSMVPWKAPWDALRSSGLHAAFPALVRETTRTISNYHFAFEEHTYRELQDASSNPLQVCLEDAQTVFAQSFKSPFDSKTKTHPQSLALAVAENSVKIAPEIGTAVYDYFGAELKDSGIDLPKNQGVPNYSELLKTPARSHALKHLREVTCSALSQAIIASQTLVEFAFQ